MESGFGIEVDQRRDTSEAAGAEVLVGSMEKSMARADI